MKTFRTKASIVLMGVASVMGYFVGAWLDEAMGGAILFAMITGIACVVYMLDNREE